MQEKPLILIKAIFKLKKGEKSPQDGYIISQEEYDQIRKNEETIKLIEKEMGI